MTCLVELGWHAEVSPVDHPASEYVFDVCISADGKRNTLHGSPSVAVCDCPLYYYFLRLPAQSLQAEILS